MALLNFNYMITGYFGDKY